MTAEVWADAGPSPGAHAPRAAAGPDPEAGTVRPRPECEANGDRGWRDWGGAGQTLHFAHANGFPPGTYRRLLEVLRSRHHVVSSEARPLWSDGPTDRLRSWSELADDLRTELARRDLNGIIAVGHSLGAAMSLLASAADPGLFAAVVAIDPLLLTGARSLSWGVLKRCGLGGRLGLVRGARSRREIWPDRNAAFAVYSRKHIFRHWQPDVLEDYLADGMVDCPQGGVRLRYPPEWEARIFEISPHDLWPRLRRIAVPTLIVRGERSEAFVPDAARRVERELPGSRVVVIPASTHFVPMERPDELGRVVLDFLHSSDQPRR